MDWTLRDVAKMIDHSLLNPVLTWDDLERGCRLARELDVASVCILPYALRRGAELLAGSDVAPSTTIGFPHGGHARATKVAEARQAIADGGVELDAVVNISLVKSGRWGEVRDELAALIETTHAAGRKIKIIFENCHLSDGEKIRLCGICGELRADWVKTSTGYGPGGATMEDLALMRKHSPPHVQVKAAGGIRDLDTLLQVRALGVSRSGASKTAEILAEARRRLASAR
jgi:deoxyribose-phosphate aldolase